MKRTFSVLLLVTLLALTFGAQGVSPASAATLVYSEDFESGYANWSMSGLWNAESEAETCGSIIAPFPSPSNAAYYGTGACNFNTGIANSGELTMLSSVALPASGTTLLSFYSLAETECTSLCSSGYDVGIVEISTDGFSWASLGTPFGTAWGQFTYNISAYNGSNVWVRFNFDSGDEIANGYFGWMVDSITITNSVGSDTTDPIVTVPSDITAEATSASGAVVNFSVSATDETSPANPSVTCDWNDGDTFPLGTTPVTCSATDDAGNTGYGYFNVTVQDTTDPVTYFDSTPPSMTNSTSATFTFHAEDAVSASANIDSYCYLDSGAVWAWNLCTSPLNLSGLSEGSHVLWIYSVDEAGNSEHNVYWLNATYGWTVDLTGPTFATDISNPYEATGPSGAVVSYNVGISDNLSGVASGGCVPPSFSTFPIGTTPVNCSGTDNVGNVGTDSFDIIVVDSTAPTLTLPANITVPQTIPAGAVVNFIVTASDIVDASPTIVCTPASGSTFPVGTTTVNCSATDDYSNTSNGSFTVTVNAAVGGNLLKKPDFASASVFPTPWQAFGFKPPYAAALDCGFFNFGSCSVVFPAGNRSAMQRVVRSGVAGDTYSFGIYSAAQNVPTGGKYLVEVAFYNNFNRQVGISQLQFNLGTHGFELVSGPAVATANYNKITFRFYYQNPSGRAWFDDAFLYFIGATN